MRWLIRRVVKKGKGSISYEEDIHFGDVLTIGRGSDQAVFLPDLRAALQHARVTAVGTGSYKVESLILAGIRVNNEITHATTVRSGAILEIGATRIQLLEASGDHDGGVEVTTLDKTEEKALKAAKALPTQLGQTWLSKRRPAWIAFTVLAVLFFAFPLLTHFSPGFSQTLRKSPLPSQGSWSPGDLAAAHHFFGQDCTVCHEKPFVPVRDEACGKCHSRLSAHADPVKFNLPELGDARCAHCHEDHTGPKGLVRRDQKLCSECHAGLQGTTKGASSLVDVADFGTGHPEFQVDLPNWDDQGNYKPIRTRLDTAGISEKSGLKYPHDKHMNKDGLKAPNGLVVLECKSCHVPEPGGAKMKPVDFETMCHDCHRLDFDPLEPTRQVPHAKVSEIIYMLDEFYAEQGLVGGYQDASAPFIVQQRRRPGEAMTPQQQQEALAWARQKSRKVADSLFESRACTVCHTVTRGREAGKPFIVAPVRVAGVWYPRGEFTHDSHVTMGCGDCHDATPSKSSADLLIPGIGNCRECHAGERTKDKVASTCIDCHGYHMSNFLVLSELQARAAKESGATPAATEAKPAAPAGTKP